MVYGLKPGLVIQLPPSLDPVPCSVSNGWASPPGKVPFQFMLTLPTVPGYFGEANALFSKYMFYYGKTHDNDIKLIENISVVQCSYSMTLSTKQVTITSSNASSTPLLNVDHSSAQDPRSVAGPGVTDAFMPYPVFPMNALPANTTQCFDLWTQVLIHLDPSLSLDDYLDPAHYAFVAQKLWSAYWAVYASAYMRLPANDSGTGLPGQLFQGSVRSQVTRVGQGSTPTRIIQALLAAVLGFSLIAAALMSMTRVLLFSPYSIGAQMRLIVGSRFAELRVLGEYMNDRELERALSNYNFAPGWSSGADGTTRYGVDIVDKPHHPGFLSKE